MNYSKIYIKDLIDTIKNTIEYQKLKNQRIFITGSTGLIGSAIVDTLLSANKYLGLNMRIFVAGRNQNGVQNRFKLWKGQYEYVQYDATKNLSFNIDFDYIIHCASNAHPLAYSNYPVETLMTNILGTNNLLEYAKNKKVKRFLYVSSSEVYGNKVGNEPYKETDYLYIDILNPRACYPSSKRACETLCASYIKEYGIDIVIARPGHIYGPTITENDSRAHAQFVRDVLAGRDIVMKSSGLQLRSYCYVFDCVSAMLSILLVGKSGEAYNISNKNSIVSIKDFAKMHAELTGHKVIFDMPSDTEKAGYNMMNCSALEASKLEYLGWKGKFSLHDGVDHTLKILIKD